MLLGLSPHICVGSPLAPAQRLAVSGVRLTGVSKWPMHVNGCPSLCVRLTACPGYITPLALRQLKCSPALCCDLNVLTLAHCIAS